LGGDSPNDPGYEGLTINALYNRDRTG